MEVVKLEIILSGVLSVMVGLVAYFLKQLVSDFKKVESDLTQVKNTTEIIRTESKGMNDLIHQRIDFLERRVNRLENQTFNES
jgi:cell division protein FtsB